MIYIKCSSFAGLLLTLQICLFAHSAFASALKQDSMSYKKVTTKNNQAIHTLKINPSKFLIKIARAKDFGHEAETVPQIAKEAGAIAAVNGGFFQVHGNSYTSPAGILKIGDFWHGISYANRGAIAWNSLSTTVAIDRVQTSSSIRINQIQYPINLLNKPSNNRSALLYSTSGTRTVEMLGNRINYIISQNQIIAISQENSITMPDNSYLYSVINNGKPLKIEIGDSAYIDIQLLPQFEKSVTNLHTWHNAEYIIGGIPLLIKNQQKITSYMPEKISDIFMHEHYARTAIGILPNKDWLFVVVEQNPLLDIEGMSLDELADFMLAEGCIDALNLDGGSSTSLYIKNKVALKLHNLTSKPVADAIVIKQPPAVLEALN